MKKLMFVMLAALSLASVSSYGQEEFILDGANAGASATSVTGAGVTDIIWVGKRDDCVRHGGAAKAVAIRISNLSFGKMHHIHWGSALLRPTDGNLWFCAQLASKEVPKRAVFADLISQKAKHANDASVAATYDTAASVPWYTGGKLKIFPVE